MKKVIEIINYSVIFFLPIYLIRIPLFDGASLNLLDVLLIIAILLNLTFLRKKSFNYKILFNKNKWLFFAIGIIILGFIVAYLANTTHHNWTDGFGILKSFIILPILFGLTLAILVKRAYLRTIYLLWAYFLSTGLIAILGYLYLLRGVLTFDDRLQIFYNSPNALAMVLVPGILIGLYLLFRKKSCPLIENRNMCLVIVLILLIAQLFSFWKTFSAGAFLALTVALVYWITIIFSRNKQIVSWLILFLIFSGFLLIFNINNFTSFINYSPSIPPTSLDSRVAIYKSSIKILKDNYLWGIGPGNFQQKYLDYQIFFRPYPQWAVPHAHNMLLHFWIEGGLLALLGIVITVVITFVRTSSQQKKFLLGTLLGALLVYFFIHGIIDNPIWKNDLAVLFWMILFVSLINLSADQSDKVILNSDQ